MYLKAFDGATGICNLQTWHDTYNISSLCEDIFDLVLFSLKGKVAVVSISIAFMCCHFEIGLNAQKLSFSSQFRNPTYFNVKLGNISICFKL